MYITVVQIKNEWRCVKFLALNFASNSNSRRSYNTGVVPNQCVFASQYGKRDLVIIQVSDALTRQYYYYYNCIDRRIYLNLSKSTQSATGLNALKPAANGRYLMLVVAV